MQLMKAAKKITALAVAFTFAFSPTQFSFAADNFTVQDGQSVPVPTQDAESFESKTTDDFDFRDVQNDLPNTESQTEGSVVITPVDQSSSEMIAQDSASQGQDNTTTTETETVVASLPSEADTSETITRAEDFVANAEDTNTTTETQTADTKGELSTYNLDDIHHRATEILEQAPDAEKTTVVSSRVECAMAGPGCGQMAHSFTFYNSNGEPLGRLEQNPNFQVQTSDPVETWYDANNNPIDILDTNSTENIPVTDKIEKSLGEVVLGVAPIIYKIVEVADSTCLSMDCPIGATTTRYVDASGKPLGSKSEITYRNNTATLVSLEGNASGTADASETRTVVTWRDKDGAEIRFVYGTVESDTFVIERGNYFYAIKRNEDGTYASSPALKQHVLSEGDHGVTEVLGVPAYSHQESTGEIACNWSGCSGTTVVETAYYSQTGVHLGLLREKYDAAPGKISFEFFDANGNLVPDNSAWNLEKQDAAKNLKIDASLIDHKMTVQQPICDGPSCPTDSTLTQYFDKNNRLLGSKEVTTYVDGINLVDNSGKIELFSEAPSELRLVIVWRDANGNEIKPDEQKLPLSEIVANFNPPLSAETQAQVDAALQDMIDPSSYTIEKDVFETVIGYTWVSRTDNTKSYHLTVWRDAEDNAHWDFTISMPIQQAVFSQAQIDQLMVQLEAQMPKNTYLRKVDTTIAGKPTLIIQIMRGQPTDTFAGSNMAGSIYIFKNADGSYDSKANLYGPSSLIQAQMIPYLVNANVALKGDYSADQQKLIQLFKTAPTLAVIPRNDVRLGYAEIIEGTDEAKTASAKLQADIVFRDEGFTGCDLEEDCTEESFKLYYSRDGKLAGKLYSDGRWVKEGETTLPSAVTDFVSNLQSRLGEPFRFSTTRQEDGTYLVTVINDSEMELSSGLHQMTFVLSKDGELDESKLTAVYNGKDGLITVGDAKLLFEAMDTCPLNEICPQSFVAPSRTELLRRMAKLVVHSASEGAIYFTKDEQSYKAYRNEDGQVVVEPYKILNLEEIRAEILKRVDASQRDNDSLLAAARAKLEEMKLLAEQRVNEFDAQMKEAAAQLEALMLEMQTIVSSDRPQTPAIDAIAAKLNEIRGFMANLEQQKESFESFIRNNAVSETKAQIAAYEILAGRLLAYQEKVAAASSIADLEKLQMEFPVLDPIIMEPSYLPPDPRDIANQLIADSKVLLSALGAGQIEEIRAALLGKITAEMTANEEAMADLANRLAEVEKLLEAKKLEINASAEMLIQKLRAMLSDLEKALESDDIRTETRLQIEAQSVEMRDYLDNAVSNEVQALIQYTIHSFRHLLDMEAAGRNIYAQKLTDHRNDIQNAASVERLRELEREFPKLFFDGIHIEPGVDPIEKMNAFSEAVNQTLEQVKTDKMRFAMQISYTQQAIAQAMQVSMQIPPVINQDDMPAMDAKIIKAATDVRAALNRLKDWLQENGYTQSGESGLTELNAVYAPQKAKDIERQAMASLQNFYENLMSRPIQITSFRGNVGEKMLVPISELVSALIGEMEALGLSRWSSPEDYLKLKGLTAGDIGEFNPGDGVFTASVFDNIMYDMLPGPSLKDLRNMVIRFISRPANSEKFVGTTKIDVKVFRALLRLPEGAVALDQVEQDLAVSVLALDINNVGKVYKTTAATMEKLFDCVVAPCDNMKTKTVETLYAQNGTLVGYKTLLDGHVEFSNAAGQIIQRMQLVQNPNEIELVQTLLMNQAVEYRSSFYEMWSKMSGQPLYVDEMYVSDDDETANKKKTSASGVLLAF